MEQESHLHRQSDCLDRYIELSIAQNGTLVELREVGGYFPNMVYSRPCVPMDSLGSEADTFFFFVCVCCGVSRRRYIHTIGVEHDGNGRLTIQISQCTTTLEMVHHRMDLANR
jgi:hypothetical protein